MRIHLFEFEDQEWLPDAVRKGVTDYLRYVIKLLNFYSPSVPLVLEAMKKTGDTTIIELCSGGGGPIESVRAELSRLNEESCTILMTDKYPNLDTFSYIRKKSNNAFDYIHDPVDAMDVPKDIQGFRLMYTAFHHFEPNDAMAILKNAVDQNRGIGIFDIGDRNIFTLIGNLIINPISILLCAPFFRPFSYSRLFFTYILPFIPLCAMWDGVVSMLRLYDVSTAKKLIEGLSSSDKYLWDIGKVRNKIGMNVFYIIGIPKSSA